MKSKISDETKKLLMSLCEKIDMEDESVRERQIRQWRRLKFFWDGFSQVYYSEIAHDWRIWDEQRVDQENSNQEYYDKPINIFKAYLESIIAALSVTVPSIKCYPDDADDALDLQTAKAGDKISELIFRHNNATLLWLKALFIYCTEGMTACYNYSKEDKKYGTYAVKEYEEFEMTHDFEVCPSCGFRPPDGFQELLEENEFDPELENYGMNEAGKLCPECLTFVQPEIQQEPLTVTRLVGTTHLPKSRQCLEVMGGLNVKVPLYAKTQEKCQYLDYSYECHYSEARSKYPDIREQIQPEGPKDEYSRWGRLSTQYRADNPINNTTVQCTWIKPSFYETCDDESDVKKLKKLFPDGVRVERVNLEVFADACNEAMDDMWTLTYNPLADYIVHDPLGLLLVSVQELTNDLVSLTEQTIEHGIPQTFADPDVLDFIAYSQEETTPGAIYPAKPKPGRTMEEAFYEVKTANLSGEVLPFAQQVQSLGQVVSGALPSIFGGQLEGSKTASEYSMSRANALQRLQNTWKMLLYWWKDIFGKVIPRYIKELKEDEKYVQRDKMGNFINVFIKKAELEGRIGNIELDASENLPINWMQRKDVIMGLLQANNPMLLEALASPENLPVIKEALGLTDFEIPGEADRTKQYEEIRLLLSSEPMSDGNVDPMTGQPIEMPSVQIDEMMDNHPIEFEVCRNWAISDVGRWEKENNPGGYQNFLLHAQQHYMMMQQQMMMQQMQIEEGNKDNKTKGSSEKSANRKAPVRGESDVKTVA